MVLWRNESQSMMNPDVFYGILSHAKKDSWAPVCFLSAEVYDNGGIAKWRNVIANYGKVLNDVILVLSDCEMLLWMEGRAITATVTNIRKLIRGSGLENVYISNTFMIASMVGLLNVLQWLDERFISKKKYDTYFFMNAFNRASKHGRIDVLEWLTKKYKITKYDLQADYFMCVRKAVRMGQQKVLAWIKFKFVSSASPLNFAVVGHICLQEAIISGKILIIDWAISAFSITEFKQQPGNRDTIQTAMGRGKFKAVGHVMHKFRIPLSEQEYFRGDMQLLI